MSSPCCSGASLQQDALTLGMALGALREPKLCGGGNGAGRGAVGTQSAMGRRAHSPCPAACLDWGTRGVAAGRQGHVGRVAVGTVGTHVAAARCREHACSDG